MTYSARELDRADALAAFRNEFLIDDPYTIYLDGNSLGRMPRRTAELVHEVVEAQWGSRLVRGWNEGWLDLPERLGDKIGQLIGARSGETIVCDSTSVNFFKLVHAALEARPGRFKIVTDDQNFPSDLYLLQGVARMRGASCEIVRVKSEDGVLPGDILGALDQSVALLTISHTAFKSGYVHDMALLTEAAHDVGALVLWDLSHSVGALPVNLEAANADLAVGCTYKYLNGGPGSPAFLYVRQDHQDHFLSPIWGWFGRRSPFDFGLDYVPAPGMRRFLAGTPPILSMAAVEVGVDLLLRAGMDQIRSKSITQTDFLVDLWEEHLASHGVTLNSPRESARRGSHISLGHPDGLRIDQALIEEAKVIPDFRYPDNIRLGVCPLYTKYSEIEDAVLRFKRVLETKAYLKYETGHVAVT